MPESHDSSACSAPATEPVPPTTVTFSAFALDLGARRLSRAGTPITLPARALDVLAYLIAHRDRIVDKDEIIAAVWRGVAVTDDSLIHAISIIRRALGDDSSRPSFIETIPRHGYRFIGSVDAGTSAVPVHSRDAAPEQTTVVERRPAPSLGAIAAAASLVLLAGISFVTYRNHSIAGASAAAARVQQPAPPGTEIISTGVLSPSGRHLAFVARDDESGRTAIWIRTLDEQEARRVADTAGASQPFFSPDGGTLAYFTQGKLVARGLRSGRTWTIASLHGAPAGGSWGTDDVIVFAVWTTGLFSVPAAGGPVSPLTRLDHTALDVAHAWPQFLPDGRRFLYQVISPDANRAGVYAGSTDERSSVRLLDEAAAATYVAPGLLLSLQRGMLMAEPFDAARLRLGGRPVLLARDVATPSLADGHGISASRDMVVFRTEPAKQQLTWVDRSGTAQGTLDVPSRMFNFRVSPDGEYVVAASSLTDSTGLWLVDLTARHSTQLEPDGIAPLWSPDGASIAFTSRAGLDLRVRPHAGAGGEMPLASDEAVKVLNDWSRERQQIVYTRHDPTTKFDLWELPITGGGSRPLLQTPFNELQARISPDGRWIAYASDAAGIQEVYVRRYPQMDEPSLVSSGGGAQPQWRGDGQELFYLAPDRSLMSIPIARAGGLTFGPPRRLFRTPIRDSASSARDSYAAMPDGRSFLIDARGAAAPAPITMMLEWAAGLVPPRRPSEARVEFVARR